MKPERVTPELAVVLIAALAMISFVLIVSVHYERAAAMAYEQSERLYAEIQADRAIVARASGLQKMNAAALADLRRISKETSLSLSTANVIEDLQASAGRDGAAIAAIEPGPAAQALPSSGLARTPITIRARGTFAQLLHFVSTLSQQKTLVSVSDSSFALAQSGKPAQKNPLLETTVHATLYRLASAQGLKPQ